MAGESPDKTEQQKSSGTAAEERDPRFAVFRDPGADRNTDAESESDAGADAGGDSGAGSGATSDTATAVFRPRLPEDARREPEAESTSAVREPEGASPEPDADPDVEPDVALDGESENGSEAGPDVESVPETASEPPRAPVAASTASGEAATPPEGPEGGTAAAEGGTSPDTDAETSGAGTSDAGTADASASAAAREPEAEPGAGDGRLRAAVAAWVDAEAEDKPTADAEDADSGAESGTDAEGEPSATADPDAAPKSKPQPEADETGETDETEETDAEPESKGEPDDKPKADAEPDKGSASSDAERESGPDADADPGSDADDASDLRGIDQPTAIFKAVKPVGAADRVDQATTALKLPPHENKPGDKPGDKPDGKPGSKSEDKPETKPEGKPESDAERTSTFVPLRSDAVRSAPAPRKPEPGAGAAPETSARTPEAAAPASPAPAAPSWAAAERTRQQPLPPRPPLDLLAELTNTPPPPETPVRTAVRRVKIWTPLVLLLLIIFAIVQVMRPLPEPSLELTAKPTYTFEGGGTKLSWPGQGQSAVMVDGVGSLGSEGAQKPAPIASVAKVMTAYVILQEHPLKGDEEGETITVDQKAEDESKRPDESTAPLTKGQQLSQRQMLQLLMIPSGNNAARLLARWDAGSEDAFIDKMNDAAKKLGMTESTYTDPSGLEKTTVSTATDQLKLAQAVMRNEVFRGIVDMPEIEIEGIDGKIYNNNNLLLQPGVSGIKTGSSTPAGGNLLWSANTKVDGKLLWIYGAVMGQQAGTGRVYDSLELSLQNSLKLIKDAQEAATSATVVKKGDVVGYVDNGFGGQTPVVATKNLKAVGWSGLEVELKVTDNGKGIDHAAKAGSEVGMVTVGTGTGKVTAPVVLQSDLTEPAFGDKLTRIG
ncbi:MULTISPECIES: serine hydrolase [Streptomyces]|uniref:serine hydrolase n=1 Tax=Streptomyces TaxID=1883 RepID=UPI00093BA434|nr:MULTISPECIES: serine hydrolase [unclassified Streptomyces]OKJ06445.1 D-alanyl-D-alanine carboxypeptidase [Streptomyces sp. TSRI0261]QNQ35889.1 serine hydrolase [Streptomyces sp. CB00271]